LDEDLVLALARVALPEFFVLRAIEHVGVVADVRERGDEQLYVAVNGQNAIRRVSPSKEVTTIAEGGVLDFPSDVIFGSDATEEDLFVANFAVSSPEDGGGPRLLRTSV
jgi:hypothetical protein